MRAPSVEKNSAMCSIQPLSHCGMPPRLLDRLRGEAFERRRCVGASLRCGVDRFCSDISKLLKGCK